MSRAFDVGTSGLERLGDAATAIGRKSGTSAADLVQAAAQISGLAKGAGFSLEETFAAISQVKTTTAKPAQTVASNLGQIFSRADQTALEAILREVGVNTFGTTLKDQIKQLSQTDLSETQRNQVSGAFGRGAAGEAALALIDGFDQIEKNAASAERATGTLSRAFDELQNSLGGRIATYINSLKLLFIELAKTGVLEVFVAFLAVTQPVIDGVTDLVSAFNSLINEGGTAARVVRDLVIALVGLNAIAARTAAGAAAAGVAGRVGAGAAVAGAVGGGALAGAGRLLASKAGVAGLLAFEGLEIFQGIKGAQEVGQTLKPVDRTLPVDKRIEELQKKIKDAQEANQLGLGGRAILQKGFQLLSPRTDIETDTERFKQLMEDLAKAYAERERQREILTGGGDSRADIFKKQPSLVQAAIVDSNTTFNVQLGEAGARGAAPTEILGLRQRAFASIDTIREQSAGADLDKTTLDDLNQALAVAGKDLFDAFQARVDELVRIKSQGKTSEQRDVIEAEARRLLRGGNLPTKITSLDQLEKAISAGFKSQLEQNRELIRNEIRLRRVKLEFIKAQIAEASDLAALLQLPDLLSAEQKRLQTEIGTLEKRLKTVGSDTGGKKLNPSFDGTGGSASKAAAEPKDTAAQIAAAKEAANAFPGSQVEGAAAAIKVAAANLAAEKRGTVAYYNALRSLRQAQFEYSQTILEAQQVSRQLGIDLTNPLSVAREELKTAQDKLRSDLSKGAPQDVVNQDKLAVQQAANQAEATKFQQNLNQVQVNFDLGKITTAQYLRYLDQQRDNLLAIANRTFQQQQNLNQVELLMKQVGDSLSGQFNIGDIKLPTVYEVRRSLEAQSGGGSYLQQTISNVITIEGADLVQVKAFLTSLLGPLSTQSYSTSTKKV